MKDLITLVLQCYRFLFLTITWTSSFVHFKNCNDFLFTCRNHSSSIGFKYFFLFWQSRVFLEKQNITSRERGWAQLLFTFWPRVKICILHTDGLAETWYTAINTATTYSKFSREIILIKQIVCVEGEGLQFFSIKTFLSKQN